MSSSARFEWAGHSDVGRSRSNNQDSYLARDGLFVVADGMGGHRGGEVASALAVETIGRLDSGPGIAELVTAVSEANEAIIERAGQDRGLLGMGTTVCAIARLRGDGAEIGLVNVGDSRIYLFADDTLTQITEDHSLVETLVRDGRLDPAEARTHPQRNVVTRALGIDDDLLVDYWVVGARLGTRFLLCSDGLIGEVDDDVIAAVLGEGDAPEATVAKLVRLANEGGGHDNITAIVVDVVAGSAEPTALPGKPRVARGDVRTGPAPSPAGEGAASAVASTVGDGRSAAFEPNPMSPPTMSPRTMRVPVPGRRWLAVVALLVVIVGLAFVWRYARGNYFVTFDSPVDAVTVDLDGDEGRQVVIFQGRPGGVLWFDPTLEEHTPVLARDLTDALVLEVEATPEFDSLSGARAYVEDLSSRSDDSAGAG